MLWVSQTGNAEAAARRLAEAGRQPRVGLGAYLADDANDGPGPVFVQRSPHFRPPADPQVPMVMSGPGIGVARGDTSRNWLFFGEQRQATDFYYRDEVTDFHCWLNDGAYVCVCGDAARMARDVDRALREIAVAHGGLDQEQADAYLRRLAADRCYVRD